MSGTDHHAVIFTTHHLPRISTKMDALLRELGLSPNETKIYLALLEYGGSGVSTVSLRSAVHRRNAYDTLKRLLRKGLVFEVQGRAETTYEAVEPGKLMELIREKEMRLANAMPQLQQMFREKHATEQAFIFKGAEGVKNYLRLALDEGEDMFLLGAEGAWLDPRTETYANWFAREAKQKKMKIFAMLDDDAHELGDKVHTLADEYKFLPPKYDTESTMDIFGDYVVTYTGTHPGKLENNVTIFVLQSPELAACFRTWWQALWDILPGKTFKRKTMRAKKDSK